MPCKSVNGRQRTSGYTMLEVLIAILLFSFGLLGIAGLQAFAIKDNHHAYLRTVAVQQAYELVDRLRANAEAAEKNVYGSKECPAGILAAQCQRAAHDLQIWGEQLAALLPSGTGHLLKQDERFRIRICWDESRNNVKTNECPAAIGVTPQQLKYFDFWMRL